MIDIYIYVYCVILVQLQRFVNEISSNEFFRCFSQALPTLFFPLHPTLQLHPTPVAHPAGELTYPVGQLEDDFPFPFSWDIFWDSFPGSLAFFSEKKRSRSSFPRTFWSSFHSFSFLNKTLHFEEETNENHQGILPRFTQRGSLIEGCDMIGYMTLLPQDPGPEVWNSWSSMKGFRCKATSWTLTC